MWLKNSLTVYKWAENKFFSKILTSNPNLTDEYLNFEDTRSTIAQFVESSILLFGKFLRKGEVLIRHLYVNQRNGYETDINPQSSDLYNFYSKINEYYIFDSKIVGATEVNRMKSSSYIYTLNCDDDDTKAC